MRLGAVTPVGLSAEENLEQPAMESVAQLLLRCRTAPCTRPSLQGRKGLNINDWIDRKEARKLDRYTQLRGQRNAGR